MPNLNPVLPLQPKLVILTPRTWLYVEVLPGMSEALDLSYLFLRVEGHHFPREQAAVSVAEEEEEGCGGLQWRLGGS